MIEIYRENEWKHASIDEVKRGFDVVVDAIIDSYKYCKTNSHDRRRIKQKKMRDCCTA